MLTDIFMQILKIRFSAWRMQETHECKKFIIGFLSRFSAGKKYILTFQLITGRSLCKFKLTVVLPETGTRPKFCKDYCKYILYIKSYQLGIYKSQTQYFIKNSLY